MKKYKKRNIRNVIGILVILLLVPLMVMLMLNFDTIFGNIVVDKNNPSGEEPDSNSPTNIERSMKVFVNGSEFDNEGSYTVGRNDVLIVKVLADYEGYQGFKAEVMPNPNIKDIPLVVDGGVVSFKNEDYSEYVDFGIMRDEISLGCDYSVEEIIGDKYSDVGSVSYRDIQEVDFYNGLFVLKITTNDGYCSETIPFNIGGVHGIKLTINSDNIEV